MYTIYGEGYGVKIQSGGNYINDGVGFIIFDVKVGDLYLLRETMEIIAKKLGAPVVPYMGQFTIDEAIDFVRKGFRRLPTVSVLQCTWLVRLLAMLTSASSRHTA